MSYLQVLFSAYHVLLADGGNLHQQKTKCYVKSPLGSLADGWSLLMKCPQTCLFRPLNRPGEVDHKDRWSFHRVILNSDSFDHPKLC